MNNRQLKKRYNYFFAGFVWLGNSRYKKYLTADKNILVEV